MLNLFQCYILGNDTFAANVRGNSSVLTVWKWVKMESAGVNGTKISHSSETLLSGPVEWRSSLFPSHVDWTLAVVSGKSLAFCFRKTSLLDWWLVELVFLTWAQQKNFTNAGVAKLNVERCRSDTYHQNPCHSLVLHQHMCNLSWMLTVNVCSSCL